MRSTSVGKADMTKKKGEKKMEEKKSNVRKDLNDMVTKIEFGAVKGRYGVNYVATVTLFNGETVEFIDNNGGVYALLDSYRKCGIDGFLVAKKLVEEEYQSTADITSDEVDEANGTYICVKFFLKDGTEQRLFPRRKYVDRKIIDNYYALFKASQKAQKQNIAK